MSVDIQIPEGDLSKKTLKRLILRIRAEGDAQSLRVSAEQDGHWRAECNQRRRLAEEEHAQRVKTEARRQEIIEIQHNEWVKTQDYARRMYEGILKQARTMTDLVNRCLRKDLEEEGSGEFKPFEKKDGP